MTRRLSTILVADVVGFSRLMGDSQARAIDAMRQLRNTFFEPLVARNGGEVVKRMGDGWIVEFPSVSDAVSSAIEVQSGLRGHEKIRLRIGIHLGEVTLVENELYGDGINIAARLEALAGPGQVLISEAVRNSLDHQAAKRFSGAESLKLKNISRQVVVWRWASTDARSANGALGRPDDSGIPSIAVLPFENMSRDPEQAYFSDGITDDIITDLGRYAGLFVIARHSSFAYRDRATPPAAIAGALGVQYIVDGSVRRSGNRIRVTARLIDPVAGNELWSGRYDRELTDIFEVQDDITTVVVNTLAGQIERQHYQRSLAKNADAVNAYDHVLRAMALIWKFDPEKNCLARTEAKQALCLDPGLARAHAVIAWSCLHEATNAICDDPVIELARSYDAACAAVAADDLEPWAHATLGWVYQWRDRATDRALAEMNRAVALNPGSVTYRSLRAFSMSYAGRSETALSELDEAMRINPHYPVAYHIFYGRALFNLGRYAEAVPHLERVRGEQPNHPNALATVAACYAANDDPDNARATVGEIIAANPRYTLSWARQILPYALDSERDHFLGMLARAGLSE